ncbi:Protein O-mannosyltransferase 2 [Kickxella alabastrina]|uniref:Protein O-mannosyltransferase 2 n=1 Tax=Kickxella alabastrina TaxID=61397 RepID=A0ACC1IMV8_9FUNG|nr:Protein O-mannosyltransferase 2 [Kickxella alabastrina]
MESRNLKQRGRGVFNDEDTLPFTSNEYNKEKQRISAGAGAGTGGLDPAHFEAAHGAVSKAYGAYPAIASDRWDGAGDGESLTDFSEVRIDAGVNGVLRSRDFVITAILTLLSLFTRLYKIGRRPNVTWDEAHFGKFGAFYINHTFYHDVHPPLAKMLVGLAEVIAGHNGTFKFGSGDKYPEYVDYTFMRAQLALYGAALVPLAYLTCRHVHISRAMSALAASFVLFDNALCVMSRFILLDQPLLFFTALTLWSATGFQNVNMSGRSYTRRWWTWLLLTGFSLGCVMSSKWIGLFCVIMVGVATADDLFRKLCDMMPWKQYAKHWAARILALIIVPLTIYVACFWLHFHYLYRTGSGDHKLSAKFQAHLKGNKLNAQPYDITYGAFVDLRAVYNGPGLLHSHIHQYPTGSRMQQVTCFPHRDTNNVWQLQKAHGIQANYTLDPIEFVNHGDIVQVVHNTTGATLRASKHVMAPLTTGHFEVAAENITDTSESGISNWRIEIVEQKHSGRRDKRLHAMTTTFRLRHADSGCLMRVGSRRLPKWGWNQSEVTCLPDSTGKKDVRSKDVLWYVERNINKRVQKDDLSKYVKSNFFIDMIQLNVEMGKTNNALGPDVNKYSTLESRPGSWPFLLSPMRMVGWGDKTTKYYEIGNPLLWWASALVCIAYPFRFLFWLVCIKRRRPGYTTSGMLKFWDSSKFLWGGWALHYIPFFFMGRVTYIHHYLPALYFGLLLLAYELDSFFVRWRKGRYLRLAAWTVGIVVCLVFVYFSPFTYGWDRPAKELAGRRWLASWNVYEDRNIF